MLNFEFQYDFNNLRLKSKKLKKHFDVPSSQNFAAQLQQKSG